MSNLSKVKLIAAVAKDAGITQDSARKALDAMWSHVVETLRAGGRVEIRDVGSFQKKTRAERKGKKPRRMVSRLPSLQRPISISSRQKI